MVERSLSMREVRGSMPLSSIFLLHFSEQECQKKTRHLVLFL